jgi:hypothetical protein
MPDPTPANRSETVSEAYIKYLESQLAAVAKERDETPIAIEWMREVGLCEWRTRLDLFFEPDGYAVRWHGWKLPKVKTRGDVRRLCSALGIQLTEPAQAAEAREEVPVMQSTLRRVREYQQRLVKVEGLVSRLRRSRR